MRSGLAVVFVFLLVLVFVSPASALKPAGKRGSDERRDWCDLDHVMCILNCPGVSGDSWFDTCNQQCNKERGRCMNARTGATIDPGVLDPNQSAGVLREPNALGYNFELEGIRLTDLEKTCQRITGAILAKDDGVVGCLNRRWLAEGDCSILCKGDKCYASMPEKPPGRLTLIGILQGGDNVYHDTPTAPPRSLVEGDGDGGLEWCGRSRC